MALQLLLLLLLVVDVGHQHVVVVAAAAAFRDKALKVCGEQIRLRRERQVRMQINPPHLKYTFF
jgi:hypothetical protein